MLHRGHSRSSWKPASLLLTAAAMLSFGPAAQCGGDPHGMVFASAEVTFETGLEPASTHVVRAFEESARSEGRREFVVTYEGEAANEYRLALVLDTRGDTLRLKNPPEVVWRRRESG